MNRIAIPMYALTLLLFVNSYSHAQDGIPKKAIKELDYMAGKWKTEVYENGKKIGTTEHERKWAPEKYCLHFTTTVNINDQSFKASGISGWTRKGRAVVEHWYGSNGASLTVRYPIRKMTADAWEGTYHRVDPDGKERKGPCRLEKKSADEWIYTSEWEEDGKKQSSKSITTRVKQ